MTHPRFMLVPIVVLLALVCLQAAPVAGETAVRILHLSIPETLPQLQAHEAAGSLADLGRSGEHFLVQFATPITPQWRDLCARQGLVLLDYIPGNLWVARADTSVKTDQKLTGNILAVGRFEPAFRLHPAVARGSFGSWAVHDDGTVDVRVYLHSDLALSDARSVAGDIGARVIREDSLLHAVELNLTPRSLERLATFDEVLWIEQTDGPLVLHNDMVRKTIKAGETQSSPYGLDGDGVVLGVWDGGAVSQTHEDFEGRLSVATSKGTHFHATHVAGTAAGSGKRSSEEGGASRQWRGMAPAADIASYDFNNASSDYEEAIGTYDIDVTNNSWGIGVGEGYANCDKLGDYDGLARGFDELVTGSEGKRVTIVFSAGNFRSSGQCGIIGTGGYRSLPPPAPAKNIITVGATESTSDNMTDFSSWGPTDDGRLKPDVVAPGCDTDGKGYINSTLPGNTYGGAGWCGTSMSSPVVAGAAALIIQAVRKEQGSDPLPSTVKALLVHAAKDLGEPGPDYENGFGRIDARSSVDRVRVDAIREWEFREQEEILEFTGTVPSGLPRLSATIAWDDPPPTPGSEVDLVNDLDLTLISPEAEVYHPWTMTPTNPGGLASRKKDGFNNVEKAWVDDPTPGEWTLRVEAATLISAQRVSVVSELVSEAWCDMDADGYFSEFDDCRGVDCDDGNDRIHPGMPENCNDAYDNNCDGNVNEGCNDGDDGDDWVDDLDDDDDSDRRNRSTCSVGDAGNAGLLVAAALVLGAIARILQPSRSRRRRGIE